MQRFDRKTAIPLLFTLLLLAAPLGVLADGGSCTENDQCGADEFCSRLFGECGNPGKCEARPTDCLEHGHPIVKPMCGCDGKTYDNVCLAALDGASIDHEGPCVTPAP